MIINVTFKQYHQFSNNVSFTYSSAHYDAVET